MACSGAVAWRRRSSIVLDDHRRRSGACLCSRREGRSYAVSYYCFAATVARLLVVLWRAPRIDGQRCRGNDHDSKESRDNAGVGGCGHERERERERKRERRRRTGENRGRMILLAHHSLALYSGFGLITGNNKRTVEGLEVCYMLLLPGPSFCCLDQVVQGTALCVLVL